MFVCYIVVAEVIFMKFGTQIDDDQDSDIGYISRYTSEVMGGHQCTIIVF